MESHDLDAQLTPPSVYKYRTISDCTRSGNESEVNKPMNRGTSCLVACDFGSNHKAIGNSRRHRKRRQPFLSESLRLDTWLKINGVLRQRLCWGVDHLRRHLLRLKESYRRVRMVKRPSQNSLLLVLITDPILWKSTRFFLVRLSIVEVAYANNNFWVYLRNSFHRVFRKVSTVSAFTNLEEYFSNLLEHLRYEDVPHIGDVCETAVNKLQIGPVRLRGPLE